MEKGALRNQIRQDLQKLSTEEKRAASARLCGRVTATELWQRARRIGAFFPLTTEPQIQALWQEPGPRTFIFPRVSGSQLELVSVADRELLAAGTWKMKEAFFRDLPSVQIEDLDLLLVPGVAYSKAGDRLGRGGGFYDRLLARSSPDLVKIGVCFQQQIYAEIPIEAHDRRMNFLATDAGFFASASS